MTHRIWFDGPTLIISISGTMGAADLVAFAEEVIRIERGGTNTPPRLTDLRDVDDMAVGYEEMARLAGMTRVRPLSAPVRSAILVARPVHLGYARMFQTLNDHPHVTVRIFDDEASARAWLEAGAAEMGPSLREGTT
jgi:hypothetical protein